jgi:hypothetical protein
MHFTVFIMGLVLGVQAMHRVGIIEVSCLFLLFAGPLAVSMYSYVSVDEDFGIVSGIGCEQAYGNGWSFCVGSIEKAGLAHGRLSVRPVPSQAWIES